MTYNQRRTTSQRETASVNDSSKKSLYGIWYHIKSRCYSPKSASYYRYGAKGIKMCDRWRNSLENFILDMGERPSLLHSIDRYPNQKGNYEPDNCRWATRKEQQNNMSRNVLITIEGQTKTMVQWCEIYGTDPHNAQYRIKAGKNPIEAVKQPVSKTLNKRAVVLCKADVYLEFISIKAAADYLANIGLPTDTSHVCQAALRGHRVKGFTIKYL